MAKNKVIEVLMHRDNMTKEQAEKQLAQVRQEVDGAIAAGDYELAEEIIAYDLGLEMDYIFDILE